MSDIARDFDGVPLTGGYERWLLERTNPDCVQAKHTACAGDAWDNELDERTTCRCKCHTTEGTTP